MTDTVCLSACYLQSLATMAIPLALHNLSAISALRNIAKHADTNPRKHLTIYNTSGAPHTGESKRTAPCKHPLCPSARLKTGSMISVRGYQTTLRLLAQKSTSAAGKRWCQHEHQLRKMALVPLCSHFPSPVWRQVLAVQLCKYSPWQKAGIGRM